MLEAIVVAGGVGSRLRPLTDRRPKHLLPVGGVPFVAHLIAKLAGCGVQRVLLATSYRAEEFRPVLGDGAAFGLRLEYVREAEPRGTAGALRNAGDRLEAGTDDPVIALNGDILSNHDIAAQLARHRASGADATLHLVEVDDARAFGCVPTDTDDRVQAFIEKSPDPVSRQINAGCYVLRRGLLATIPSGRAVSVERETFPGLLAAGAFFLGHLESSYWLDVGTPSALVRASCDLVRGVTTSPAYGGAPAERRLLPGCAVDPTAVVTGGSVIATGARVGARALVEASVVMDGAVVGENAVVRRSVVAPCASIGRSASLDRAVVGDGSTVGDSCELVPGARVDCGARIGAGAVRL